MREYLRESFILGDTKPENLGKETSFTVLNRKDRREGRGQGRERGRERKPVTIAQNHFQRKNPDVDPEI